MSEFAYLTTIGRRTGRPHCIEIWYAEDRGTLYLLSGDADRADWVRNLRRNPRARIRRGGHRERRVDLPGTVEVTARFVADPAEEALARRLLAAKYQDWQPGQPLSDWACTALVVALG